MVKLLMLRSTFIMCSLCLLHPSTAAGGKRSVILVAGEEGRALSPGAVNARLGAAVRICAVVKDRTRRGTLYYTDAKSLRLRGHALSKRRRRPLARLGPVKVRWFQVEPRPHHTLTASPNQGNPAYSNAKLFGPRHGKWLGYDTLEAHETSIPGAHGSCLVVRRTRPSHPRVNVNRGLGTMRYRVEVELSQGTLSSPGAEASRAGGISARILRITFRSGDNLTGYLRGFFNVPNVFGSAGQGRSHQTEQYKGADCADVIIGAARQAGARIPYTSVAGLRRYMRPVSSRLLMNKQGIFNLSDDGQPAQPRELKFGQDLRSGDIMLIDYAGFSGSPRRWDHIAVIDQDRGTRGVLDPRDPVLHMGYLYGLVEEPAQTQAPAYIQILRFRPGVLRAIKRQQKQLARSRIARR